MPKAAVRDGVKTIEVSGTIKGASRVVLAPGVSLRGGRLEFGSKGVLLTRDNTLEDIEVVTPEHAIAIYGLSLVKGVQMRLKAVALSIKPGGQVGSLSVGGRIHTSGRDVVSVEIEGDLHQLRVTGGISATGDGSDAVRARDGGSDFTDITVTSEHGQKLVRTT